MSTPSMMMMLGVSGGPQAPTSVECLVAAGGGSVPAHSTIAGGAGAGGLRTSTSQAVTAGFTYTITVGGAGGNSSFGALVSCTAGGNAGYDLSFPNNTGLNGGSGGGSSYGSGGAAGSGISGEGNAGGSTTFIFYGGGGGGAGSAGQNAAAASGFGGAGLASSITGASLYYSAGAGGRDYYGGTINNGTGWSASANTGNGAASATTSGATGYSGVVIIAYPNTYTAPASITGTYTTPSRPGYRVYRFTGSGSITF